MLTETAFLVHCQFYWLVILRWLIFYVLCVRWSCFCMQSFMLSILILSMLTILINIFIIHLNLYFPCCFHFNLLTVHLLVNILLDNKQLTYVLIRNGPLTSVFWGYPLFWKEDLLLTIQILVFPSLKFCLTTVFCLEPFILRL